MKWRYIWWIIYAAILIAILMDIGLLFHNPLQPHTICRCGDRPPLRGQQ